MGPHGVENTGLQNPRWLTHDGMKCNECVHPEPMLPAVKVAPTASPEVDEVMMNEETEQGGGEGAPGEAAGLPVAAAPPSLFSTRYPKESTFDKLLEIAGNDYILPSFCPLD